MKSKKNITIGSSLTAIIVLLGLWQLSVMILALPNYILPSPLTISITIYHNLWLLITQTVPTLIEILLGLVFGILFGMITAILLAYLRPAKFLLLPLILISQALPTFAIAPLFVIWFGYGMVAKIAVTILMIFFPITSNFYDGLNSTPKEYLDLGHIHGKSDWRLLWFIRIPAGLKALASGLRLACVFSPMGAIIGEWIGANKGLGYLILNANARMEISLMFAALFFVILLTLSLYFTIDWFLKYFIDNHYT